MTAASIAAPAMPERNARPRRPAPRVEVTEADLPLYCPRPPDHLWNSHPRVYLPLTEGGEEACPYCGTVYVLGGDAESPSP